MSREGQRTYQKPPAQDWKKSYYQSFNDGEQLNSDCKISFPIKRGQVCLCKPMKGENKLKCKKRSSTATVFTDYNAEVKE